MAGDGHPHRCSGRTSGRRVAGLVDMRGRDGMLGMSRAEFDAVFCGLLPRLYRRAAMLVDAATAEDVVHEAYLKLATRPDRLTAHPQPYAYAYATMVSVIRD